jgi:hypothetical protein
MDRPWRFSKYMYVLRKRRNVNVGGNSVILHGCVCRLFNMTLSGSYFSNVAERVRVGN